MDRSSAKKRRVDLTTRTTSTVSVPSPFTTRVSSKVPILAFLEATTLSCATVHLDRLVTPRVLPVNVESPIVGLVEMEDRYLCQWILAYLSLKDLWSFYRVTRHRLNIFRMIMCGRPVATIPPALHGIFIEMLGKVCVLLCLWCIVSVLAMFGPSLNFVYPGRGEAIESVPLLGGDGSFLSSLLWLWNS